MDKEKKSKNSASMADAESEVEINAVYRKLQSQMKRPKPSEEEIAAAMESAQRLAAEADAEDAADDTAQDVTANSAAACPVCEYRNREGTKFCRMCGATLSVAEAADEPPNEPQAIVRSPIPPPVEEPERMPSRPTGNETHHYHHHYHHHYFPGAGDGMGSRPGYESRDLREEKLRPTAALRGDLSRAEAGVRRVTQEWVLACNTKHLDDLLELYTADAMVLRSNYSPVRGAPAIREFFFGALDAGLGEAEMEPLRVDVVGELAYEAGRFKALVPSATGKRREERGKYLWVCARQSNGEWKLAADCWSSDLMLTTLESDVPLSAGVRTNQGRKS